MGWSMSCGQCGRPTSRAAPVCPSCGWVIDPGAPPADAAGGEPSLGSPEEAQSARPNEREERPGRTGFWASLFDLFGDNRGQDETSYEFFYVGLGALGIPVQFMRRGSPEERLIPIPERLARGVHSLGVVPILSGPIGWVSVLRRLDDDGAIYYAVYGVPDARLADVDVYGLRLEAVASSATRPHVRWTGEDMGLGLLETLNSRSAANAGLVPSKPIYLRAYRSHRCWTLALEIRMTSYLASWTNPPTATPSREQWRSYEAIASCLLRTNLTRA